MTKAGLTFFTPSSTSWVLGSQVCLFEKLLYHIFLLVGIKVFVKQSQHSEVYSVLQFFSNVLSLESGSSKTENSWQILCKILMLFLNLFFFSPSGRNLQTVSTFSEWPQPTVVISEQMHLFFLLNSPWPRFPIRLVDQCVGREKFLKTKCRDFRHATGSVLLVKTLPLVSLTHSRALLLESSSRATDECS